MYNPDGSKLAHIYIPESNPDMVEGSFKHYIGGKLVLVPKYIIDKNPNLPEYLSTIYDSLFGGCHIDFNAVPCLPEKNVNCEDGKESSICVIM